MKIIMIFVIIVSFCSCNTKSSSIYLIERTWFVHGNEGASDTIYKDTTTALNLDLNMREFEFSIFDSGKAEFVLLHSRYFTVVDTAQFILDGQQSDIFELLIASDSARPDLSIQIYATRNLIIAFSRAHDRKIYFLQSFKDFKTNQKTIMKYERQEVLSKQDFMP